MTALLDLIVHIVGIRIIVFDPEPLLQNYSELSPETTTKKKSKFFVKRKANPELHSDSKCVKRTHVWFGPITSLGKGS